MITANLRQKILEKAAEAGVDKSKVDNDIAMLSDLPFEKAYLSFENQVLQQQLEAMKSSNTAISRHKSKAQATKDTP